MPKIEHIFFCLIGFLCSAQVKVNLLELQRIGAEQELVALQQEQIKKNFLDTHNWQTIVNGKAQFVGIYNGVPVVREDSGINQDQAANIDLLRNGNLSNGLNLDGSGIRIYVWDGNQKRPRITHQELSGRVTTNAPESNEVYFHATGVVGVIAGNGTNANAIGAAPNATVEHDDFNDVDAQMPIVAQANPNYMLSNHSYNYRAGWVQDGANWLWYGYPHLDENESPLHGFYGSIDELIDEVAYANPNYTILHAAGNDFNEGPPPGTTHSYLDQNNNWISSTTVRPKNCQQTGFDCIPYNATAKNMILVGAVEPITGGRYTQANDVFISNFSSRGPTDDGRIKPDLVAVGSSVTAANSTADNAYANFMGTSFSTPSVTGIAGLLQQLAKESTNQYLRSDELKALLCHTALDAGNIGPDYTYGWGLINALDAGQTLVDSYNNNAIVINQSLSNSQVTNISVTASGSEPIKATLVWIDPAATAAANISFNNRTPSLINDLDLRIIDNSNQTTMPWILDVENPAIAATKGDNLVDNVEQVLVENPTANASYTVRISHKNNLINAAQQYALVVTGISDSSLNVVGFNNHPNQIQIAPNPVQDKLQIQAKLNQNQKIQTITIYKMNGQRVKQLVLENKTIPSIDVSSFTAGVYLLEVKTNQNTITKKWLKR